MTSKKSVDATKYSVDEIILGLPRQEQVIVKRLRALILETLPHAVEKNNYGAPFYVGNRMMLFIWPPSLYWGNNRKLPNKGVTLGFCQGNRMDNSGGHLLVEGRKQVYCMYFNSLKEIDEDLIRALIFEADLVDKQFRKKPKRKGHQNADGTQ
jgi:hypothetical protein